jgi:hypothetical protein
MKALVYEKAHSLADFAIKLIEIRVPQLFTVSKEDHKSVRQSNVGAARR